MMVEDVVVLSGGLDSTTALALALDHSRVGTAGVGAISFAYGQRHSKELVSAARIAAHYGVAHRVIPLDGLLAGSGLLGVGEIPHGHYTAATMAATVVLGRNLLFAAAAVAAAAPGASVWFGVHAGDHHIYADCRPEFWDTLGPLVLAAYGVHLKAPLLNLTKADGVRLGHALEAPLDMSWSCYEGGDLHCGRCGTCVERAEAFVLAGVRDTTSYTDPDFWSTTVTEAL